jgi:stage IV sporulation protein FB
MKKFKLHFSFYVIAFFALLTGLFKDFMLFSSLIFIHELGHILGGLIFKWKINKVIIMPLGGLTKFEYSLSKSSFEEMIILVLGPLFQIIYYALYTMYFGYNSHLYYFHYALLIFNLMPIYPLDGFKALNLILHNCLSFYKSIFLSLIISLTFVFCLLVISLTKMFNLVIIISLFILLSKNIDELANLKFLFNKFLLERYLGSYNFKKEKVVKNIYDMQKNKRHIFVFDNEYITEKAMLKAYFKKTCP